MWLIRCPWKGCLLWAVGLEVGWGGDVNLPARCLTLLMLRWRSSWVCVCVLTFVQDVLHCWCYVEGLGVGWGGDALTFLQDAFRRWCYVEGLDLTKGFAQSTLALTLRDARKNKWMSQTAKPAFGFTVHAWNVTMTCRKDTIQRNVKDSTWNMKPWIYFCLEEQNRITAQAIHMFLNLSHTPANPNGCPCCKYVWTSPRHASAFCLSFENKHIYQIHHPCKRGKSAVALFLFGRTYSINLYNFYIFYTYLFTLMHYDKFTSFYI